MSVIGTAIGGLLVSIAGKVGATAVKKAIEGPDGGLAGHVIGRIIDRIGEKLGRRVDDADLPGLPAKDVETAVAAVEAEMPEILLQWNEQQRATHEMLRAEMDKTGAWWTWAWRPAGMWMFNALVVWYAAAVPIINFVAAVKGLSARMEMVLEVASFVALYMFFAGLYMGGHTAKDFFTKAAGALGQWRGRS